MDSFRSINTRLTQRTLFLFCTMLLPLISVQSGMGQRMSNAHREQVIFDLSFSPDGKTLAIVRGANSANKQLSRVELWNAEDGSLRHTITGFDGQVWSVSFSPDGNTIVTGSSEYRSDSIREGSRWRKRLMELKWWDTQTGNLKKKLTLPDQDRMSIAATFSPNGKLLATVDSYVDLGFTLNMFPRSMLRSSVPRITSGADLKLLDAETGETVFKLKDGFKSETRLIPRSVFQNRLRSELLAGGGFVRRSPAALFSSDSQFVAAWNPSEIRIWDTQTGKQTRRIKNFKRRLSAISFAPEGHLLAAAVSNDFGDEENERTPSEVRLYDAASGKLTNTFQVQTNVISTIVFVPNGTQMLVGGLRKSPYNFVGNVELIDLIKGSTGSLPVSDNETVRSLAISGVDKLALQLGGIYVETVNPQSWKTEHRLMDSDAVDTRSSSRYVLSVKSVLSVAFLADGTTLVGEVEQGGIKQWDIRTGEVKKHLRDKQDAPLVVAFSRNGKSMAELGEDNTLHIWDFAKGTNRVVPITSMESVSALALADDGHTLAISGEDSILVFNSSSEATPKMLPNQNVVTSLSFSADARILAIADEDGQIRLVESSTGKALRAFDSGGSVTALSFSPDGQALACAGEDNMVTIWNPQTGALIAKLKKHDAAVNALAFSPDGQFLASGGDDRAIVIWEMSSRKSKRTLKGHDVTVSSLAFSPDGNLIASGTGNASVVLWDVRTGKLDRVLK